MYRAPSAARARVPGAAGGEGPFVKFSVLQSGEEIKYAVRLYLEERSLGRGEVEGGSIHETENAESRAPSSASLSFSRLELDMESFRLCYPREASRSSAPTFLRSKSCSSLLPSPVPPTCPRCLYWVCITSISIVVFAFFLLYLSPSIIRPSLPCIISNSSCEFRS